MTRRPAQAAFRCGTALGYIRSPKGAPRLVALLGDRSRPNFVRVSAAEALGLYRDRAYLPLLCARLNDRSEDLYVLRQAADSVNLVVQSAEVEDPAVANALFFALRNRDLQVRFYCLQALLSVPAKYDVSALFPAMEDGRSLLHIRICDNASWVFEERIGKRLEGRKGDIAGFLKAWYGEHKDHLRWDSARGAWTEVPAGASRRE